jgi:hypothetical protein
MITNNASRIGSEREYEITLETIRELEADLAKAEAYRAKRDPQVHHLVVAGIKGFLSRASLRTCVSKPQNTKCGTE